MSVINNVLKDLQARESGFTPIEIESISRPRRRYFDAKTGLLAGLAACAIGLVAWTLLRPPDAPAVPLASAAPGIEATVPVVTQETASSAPMVPATVVEPAPGNQIIGLQMREAEREMRLEFALRERAVAYLKERGENSFAYHLRDIDSEIVAPRLQDNRYLADLEIVTQSDGVDILFKTLPGILVETRQINANGAPVWVIDLRQPAPIEVAVAEREAEPAITVAPAAPVAASPAPEAIDEPVESAEPEALEPVVTPPQSVAASDPPKVRLEIKSTDPDAGNDNQLDYAITLMQSRRYADAQNLLQKLLDGSADFAARRQLLVLYDHRQQHASFARLARESSLRYPDDLTFRGEYGRALLQQGAYPAVIELFAGRDRLDASQHALVAASHQRLDQHADAIRHYELALELEQRDARNWIGLGISQEHSKDLEAALRSYRIAARLGQLTPRLQAFLAKRTETLQRVLN